MPVKQRVVGSSPTVSAKNILIKLKQFNIAYTIDNNDVQLEMLRMSIDTLLKFNKVDNIFIMYFDVDENKIRQKLFDLDVNIEYFNFDISLVDQYFPQLKNARNKRLRYPSLARWWITKIIPYDYFWYIDTDVLFNANIRDEFLKYQEGKLFFGFNRKLYNVTRDITSEIFIEGIYLNLEELNAGILFINAKQFNDMNLFDIILKYYKENAKYIRFVNQTGYNYLFNKFEDKCTIKIENDINIKPFINYPEVFERQIKNAKIFHCNGKNKRNFIPTYNIIMCE